EDGTGQAEGGRVPYLAEVPRSLKEEEGREEDRTRGNFSPFKQPSLEDADMPGEELHPSLSPDHPREVERAGETQPSPGDATKFTGEQKTSSKPDHQAGSDHLQNMGTLNPGFVEEPPPYAPPDPKDVHLYPPFQTAVPPQSCIFYQPTAATQLGCFLARHFMTSSLLIGSGVFRGGGGGGEEEEDCGIGGGKGKGKGKGKEGRKEERR
ncbi:Dam1, partial [Ophiophagus hannah]